MGLVKTRRLAAMQKQQKAKAGMKPPMPKTLPPTKKADLGVFLRAQRELALMREQARRDDEFNSAIDRLCGIRRDEADD